MISQALRESMRRWATGVAVVTSRYREDEHGMTVNSFTSISLDPPLVLVALDRSSRTCAMVSQSGVFGVTILASDQQDIAERFAGQDGSSQNRFAGIDTQRLVSGVPFIAGGLAYLDCRVSESYQIATHRLLIGHVVDIRINSEPSGEPLLYLNQSYQQLAG
jgi:flavin reductase (DIM6/NTAB) family NADH-FMN oxidoreductase RutF